MSPHLFYNTYHHMSLRYVTTPLLQHLLSHVITLCQHTSSTTLIITCNHDMSPHLFYNTYHYTFMSLRYVTTPFLQHLSSPVITICHHTSSTTIIITVCHHTSSTTLIITCHYGMSPHLFYNTYHHISLRYATTPLLQHLSLYFITVCHHTSFTTHIITCHYSVSPLLFYNTYHFGMSRHLFYNTYDPISLRYVTTPLLQHLTLRYVTTPLLQHLSSHVMTVCHNTSSTTLIITCHYSMSPHLFCNTYH